MHLRWNYSDGMTSIHETEMDPVAGARAAWPMAKRIAFRFAFVFWILFDNGLGLVLWVWPWLDRHVSMWVN